jgi:3D (Asp-Asp-Asp) domain-containing protein
MSSAPRLTARRVLLLICAAGGVLASASAAFASGAPPSSGGAAIMGIAPTPRHTGKSTARPSKRDHGRWLSGVTITEYWPAPESWFVGEPVSAPGLPGKHRIDWLYSAMGVSMEGQGLGLDGRIYHIDSLGSGGWLTLAGVPTSPSNGWASGAPYWRAGGYWRTSSGAVTFPLQQGGWSSGRGRTYVPLLGVTFAPGAALPLSFYQSIAVDPSVIPLGSRVYIPAYKNDGHGGWFVAQDTGGAINGTHVDVYRTPPASPNEGGQYSTGQWVYVVKPRRR